MQDHSRSFLDAVFIQAPVSVLEEVVPPKHVCDRKALVKCRIASRKNAGRDCAPAFSLAGA